MRIGLNIFNIIYDIGILFSQVKKAAEPIERILKVCPEDTKALLKPFVEQMGVAVKTLCLMATCNLEKAKECVSAGKHELESVVDEDYTNEICRLFIN